MCTMKRFIKNVMFLRARQEKDKTPISLKQFDFKDSQL